MKIHVHSRIKRDHGAALIIAVLMLVLVAVVLCTYLLQTENEYITVQRSQTWNNSLTVAEAGVEEAFALINKYAYNNNMQLTNWTATATADNWNHLTPDITAGGNTIQVFSISRALPNNAGAYTVYVTNVITATNVTPCILSIGTVTNTIGPPCSRKVYVQTIPVSQLGYNGLIAYALTFDGNNVTIDSFDSSSSAHSIWHTNLWFQGANYGTWSNTLSYDSNSIPSRTADVHVAAETNYISVGNANVYGYIDTSPGGTYNVKNNGSVGDLNWVHNGTSGLQPGHFRDDMNQPFFSKNLPVNFINSVQTNNWLPVPTGAAGTTNVIRIGCVYNNGILTGTGLLYTNKNNAGWVLPGGDGNNYTYKFVITNRPQATNNIYYTMDSIGSGNLFVDSQYAVLYLTNGMSSPILTINTNADLTIYSRGDITFGTTVNESALARALTINDIAGYPINITASGNASGVGKLYVPSSSLKFNGGGNNTYDIIGEIVGNNVEFNGHFNLHYDESLGSASVSLQFATAIWKEVP